MLIAALSAGSLLEFAHGAVWHRVITVSIFLTLSILAFYGHAKAYRGGAATITGAVLLGLAVIGIASALKDGDFSGSARQIAGVVIVTVLLVTGGVALLRQGHRHHLLLQQLNQLSRRQE
ncbi:MAG: hypothetical protein ACOY3E_14375 [Pseudomonadota bacterium]